MVPGSILVVTVPTTVGMSGCISFFFNFLVENNVLYVFLGLNWFANKICHAMDLASQS